MGKKLNLKIMLAEKQLYKKLTELALEIKENLRERGYVVPAENEDGKVKIGNYFIVKDKGFFSVTDLRNNTVYEKINLPQTALIIANSLALGQTINNKILENDQQYGYGYFEDLNYNRLFKSLLNKKDYDKFEALLIKQELAQSRAEHAKNYILTNFEKLRRMR